MKNWDTSLSKNFDVTGRTLRTAVPRQSARRFLFAVLQNPSTTFDKAAIHTRLPDQELRF